LAQVFQSLFLAQAVAALPDWSDFSFKQAVLQYESDLITLALEESGGSVTRAARLLGFTHHQSLSAIINTRHQNLLSKRAPIRKRRKHFLAHPKRKRKQPQ